MNLKTILSDIIEKEFERIEGFGEKVRLKTARKRRIIYTLIFGILFIWAFLSGISRPTSFIYAFILLIIYFVLLFKNTDTDIIIGLAKKAPNKQISEIIKEEMIK